MPKKATEATSARRSRSFFPRPSLKVNIIAEFEESYCTTPNVRCVSIARALVRPRRCHCSAQNLCTTTSVTWSLTPELAGGMAGGLCPLIAVCPLIGVPVEVPYASSIRARARYETSNPTGYPYVKSSALGQITGSRRRYVQSEFEQNCENLV